MNLLDKSALNGKKVASDPLFTLAAQFLAADLNVQAGAGLCRSSATAINQAQALLVTYHFDGTGYSPKLTSADASLARRLATTIDEYNNAAPC